MTSVVREQLLPDRGAATPLAGILREQRIVSHYQPILDLTTGEVVACEALARGPEGPLSSPLALFAAARREGLLPQLDRECQAAAFRGAVRCGLTAPMTLFVNVEPEVVDGTSLEDLRALAQTGGDDVHVVLEITERALASRPAQLLRTVERVRRLGWGVALDDVGAEPASLAFMELLQPDVVKLDLALTQGRPSPAIAAVMHAVNAYAERTGALVLAEGIETADHLLQARALGARLGQGWLLGLPVADPSWPSPERALPLRPTAASGSSALPASPFAALPPGTVLARSPKRLLVELSKLLEREAARVGPTCVVTSTFQHDGQFTAATAARYADLARHVGFVCAIGEGLPEEPLPGVRGATLSADDPVLDEWDVVVLAPHFSTALLARELDHGGPDMERMFEYALTYRRDTVVAATRALMARVAPSGDLSQTGAAGVESPPRVGRGTTPTRRSDCETDVGKAPSRGAGAA